MTLQFRIFTSTGSPIGATLITSKGVPGVKPRASNHLRYDLSQTSYPIIVPVSPDDRSFILVVINTPIKLLLYNIMRLLSTLHPTQTQLTVIAKIVANKEHPARAIADLSNNMNLVTARNMLMKLNVITVSDTSAELTDLGNQLAKQYNIVDDAGELTEEGRKLTGEEEQPPAEPGMSETPPPGGGDIGALPPPGGDMGLPPMEGFSPLFKRILIG